MFTRVCSAEEETRHSLPSKTFEVFGHAVSPDTVYLVRNGSRVLQFATTVNRLMRSDCDAQRENEETGGERERGTHCSLLREKSAFNQPYLDNYYLHYCIKFIRM